MKLKDRIINGLAESDRDQYTDREIFIYPYLDTEEMSEAVAMVANLFAEAKRIRQGGETWSGINESHLARTEFYKQLAEYIMRRKP